MFPTRRGIEQWLARRAHNPEVTGSNPVPATKKFLERLKQLEAFLFCRKLVVIEQPAHLIASIRDFLITLLSFCST